MMFIGVLSIMYFISYSCYLANKTDMEAEVLNCGLLTCLSIFIILRKIPCLGSDITL